MMVFNKILVALDRSSQAPVVFEKALELSQVHRSNLMIFHCLDWETEQAGSFIGIGTLGDLNMYTNLNKLRHESLQKDIEQARGWLEIQSQQAAAKSIPVEFDCKLGTAGSSICEQARSWNADLIIIGRRGHRGLSELLLGSISNYVIHHAPCSVLVIQGITQQDTDAPATDSESKIS